MDDSGVYSTASAPCSPSIMAQSVSSHGCCHVDMLCFEDPSTLSPEDVVYITLPPPSVSASSSTSSKRSYEETTDGLPPPNTPIKRRRLSRPRASLVDTHPIHLPSAPSDRSINVNVVNFGRQANGQSFKTDRKSVLRTQHLDHVGFEEYEIDIYLHRRSIELKYHPVECLCHQPQVTPGMRGALVEWLTKLHHRFVFAQDTLFLTVNILDRFLITTPISHDIFQLLGITSLLVAAKQEEQYPPEIADLLLLCDESHTREKVQQLERVVLCRLRFDLMAPTSQFFLEHYSAARLRSLINTPITQKDFLKTRSLARYLLELSLQDYSICQYAPSLLALGVLEVSDEVLNQCTHPGSLYAGGFSRGILQECMSELHLLATAFCHDGPDMDLIHSKYNNLYSEKDC